MPLESRVANFDGVSSRLGKRVSEAAIEEQPDRVIALGDHFAARAADSNQRVVVFAEPIADHLERDSLPFFHGDRIAVDRCCSIFIWRACR